jgi:hypothetical protein
MVLILMDFGFANVASPTALHNLFQIDAIVFEAT